MPRAMDRCTRDISAYAKLHMYIYIYIYIYIYAVVDLQLEVHGR